MLNRLLRWYLYARRGLGHVGAVLSGVTFVNTVYLVSREWVFIGGLGYIEIMGIGALVLFPVLVYLGYLDYKKGFFKIEASVATEENPYLIDKFTVKERGYLLPVTLGAARLSLAVNKELTEKLEIATPEVQEAYNYLEKAYHRLLRKMVEAEQ